MTHFHFARLALFLLAASCLLSGLASGQNRRNQRPVTQPSPAGQVNQKGDEPHKQNARPEAKPAPAAAPTYTATHFFQFERPGFTVPRIWIEHDDKGIGKISFEREGLEERISDPLALSPLTVKTINEALDRLSFLDSAENYQYENDMPQMGNNTFTLKRPGKERTVKYNWTTNKDAKLLIDEYRRVGNEYVWRFEMATALENQPLRTPKLLADLESLVKRNEISDIGHMVPLLTDLQVNERVPLIGRNTASRIIKQAEKSRKR